MPKKRTSVERAQWLGETLRLRLSIASWQHGESHVDIAIVRELLMFTSAEDIAKRHLIPALITLNHHIAKKEK